MTAKQFWIAFAILGAVSMVPIAVTEILPYLDYPNHLARAKVLAHYGENPFYAEFWRPAWAVLPNILTDLLLVAAAKVLPITLAGRVVQGLIILTIGLGVAVARRELIGRYDALGFGGLLLAYGFPIQMAFLNFSLGVGLLLLLFALHVRLRERGSAGYLLAMVPGAIGLFLCHLMAFALFLIIVLAWEFGRGEPRARLQTLCRLGAASVIPAVLFLLSPTNGQVSGWVSSTPMVKLKAIPLSFSSGDLATDLLFLALLVLMGWRVWKAKFRWDRSALTVLGLLFALFVVAPFGLGSTGNLDNRIPYVIGILAITFLLPANGDEPRTLRTSQLAGIVIGALAVHAGMLGVVSWKRGRSIDQARAQIRTLPAGSLLFNAVDKAEPVWRFSTWNPPVPNLHTVALIDGDVFPSGLFMIRGQQPLLMRSGLDALYWARAGEGLQPTELAREIAENLRPLPQEIRRRPRFLMMCGPESVSPALELFARGPRYAIYRLPSE